MINIGIFQGMKIHLYPFSSYFDVNFPCFFTGFDPSPGVPIAIARPPSTCTWGDPCGVAPTVVFDELSRGPDMANMGTLRPTRPSKYI